LLELLPSTEEGKDLLELLLQTEESKDLLELLPSIEVGKDLLELLLQTEECKDLLELLLSIEEPGTIAPDIWEILLFEAAGFESCCTSYKWQGNCTSKSPTTQNFRLSSVAKIVATWTTGMALPSEHKIVL